MGTCYRNKAVIKDGLLVGSEQNITVIENELENIYDI